MTPPTCRRRPGLAVLGDMPWGSHCCHFFLTRKDLVETLVPFFMAGRARMAWRVFRANKTCPRCRALSGRLARSSREFRARISKLLIAADGAAPR